MLTLDAIEFSWVCVCECVCVLSQSETQQKAEAAPEDSDLDRKRRETEALLQSIGISPEPPLGTLITMIHSLRI